VSNSHVAVLVLQSVGTKEENIELLMVVFDWQGTLLHVHVVLCSNLGVGQVK